MAKLPEERVRQILTTRRRTLTERHEKVARHGMHREEPLERDSEDQAIQLENDDPLQAIDAAALGEIAEIDAALSRIDQGLYGTCKRCNGPIAAERLRAVPHALMCAACARTERD